MKCDNYRRTSTLLTNILLSVQLPLDLYQLKEANTLYLNSPYMGLWDLMTYRHGLVKITIV